MNHKNTVYFVFMETNNASAHIAGRTSSASELPLSLLFCGFSLYLKRVGHYLCVSEIELKFSVALSPIHTLSAARYATSLLKTLVLTVAINTVCLLANNLKSLIQLQ